MSIDNNTLDTLPGLDKAAVLFEGGNWDKLITIPIVNLLPANT